MVKRICVCFIWIAIISVFLCGCYQGTPNLNPARIRLADDYNSDWANQAIGELNFDSSDQCPTVAVIDTGCNVDSPQIIKKYNVVSDNNVVTDKNGHGSIITGKFLDINSYVNFYIIKISDDAEKIKKENLAKGIYKAIENNVDVINLSLGTDKNYDEVRQAIEKAKRKNITVIASSGNTGGEILYPAKYNHIISVMARDINNLDIVSNSKSKSKRSFSAPGEHILVNGEYVTGTSIAAIYITNAVAYIKSYNPNIEVSEIIEMLEKASDYPTEYSYGMINYTKLYEQLN